jgi:hypothetical protein
VAAPTIQAEGTIATGVTTGVPSITIPAHQADDILVVVATVWVPNTLTPDAAQIPTPSTWNLLGTQIGQPAASPRDGWHAVFWKRAAGAGETVTFTRGAGWDDGTDTVYNGIAFVIRGCTTTGDPFENATTAGPYTTANQNLPAVTVSGNERRVCAFAAMQDNVTLCSAASGYTVTAAAANAGGTDSAFRLAHRTADTGTVAAVASTTSAPVQGSYGFISAAFKPPTATSFPFSPVHRGRRHRINR